MPFKDPAKRKQYHKEYSAKWERSHDRWSDPKRRKSQKEYHKSHPERMMETQRRIRYGLSPEEYELRVKEQNGLCALCGRPEPHINYRTGKQMSLSVDHNHVTGKNRDLLCGDCNHGLGLFDEDIDLLMRAIQYLRKHGEQ